MAMVAMVAMVIKTTNSYIIYKDEYKIEIILTHTAKELIFSSLSFGLDCISMFNHTQ